MDYLFSKSKKLKHSWLIAGASQERSDLSTVSQAALASGRFAAELPGFEDALFLVPIVSRAPMRCWLHPPPL